MEIHALLLEWLQILPLMERYVWRLKLRVLGLLNGNDHSLPTINAICFSRGARSATLNMDMEHARQIRESDSIQ